MIKKYEELWSRIRDLIRSITKNSGDHDKKYMKIRFKTIEIHNANLVIRAVFHKIKEYCPQVFLDECLYEL